jgi:glycosyltransferase involved in cell wall biosynthesis
LVVDDGSTDATPERLAARNDVFVVRHPQNRGYGAALKTAFDYAIRFNYDVLCHTDLLRTSGESFGTPLNRINWGNYDLVVIDESHNFRNNDAFKDRETRYQKLMNSVIRQGVKTKVLMLSATPVNNRFNDLKNQLALAYEGDSAALTKRLRTEKDINEIFRQAQSAFNVWSTLPPEERTAAAILGALSFDFFELLDSVTIARSRRHIETFYDTKDIGSFPERRKPLSFHCPLTQRTDVIGFNQIFNQLSLMKLAVYAPVSYILPSRLAKYEDLYDTEISGKGTLKQVECHRDRKEWNMFVTHRSRPREIHGHYDQGPSADGQPFPAQNDHQHQNHQQSPNFANHDLLL